MLTEIELKEKLIAKISDTDDIELLKEMSDWFDFDIEKNAPHIMSAEEEAAVKEGLGQLDRGEYVSHEDAKKYFSKWSEK